MIPPQSREPLSREDAAEGLREQAASFRRLAKTARTDSGSAALKAIAEEFDTDARRMDPSSERR
jgi:hypothetical protein